MHYNNNTLPKISAKSSTLDPKNLFQDIIMAPSQEFHSTGLEDLTVTTPNYDLQAQNAIDRGEPFSFERFKSE